MTILSEILDPVSLDHLAQHLAEIEEPPRVIAGPGPVSYPVDDGPFFTRTRRTVPTRNCSSAGGRSTAIKRKLAKIRQLTEEVEALRTAK